MIKDVKRRAIAALSATLTLYEEMDIERERRINAHAIHIDLLEKRVAELEKLVKEQARETSELR